MVLIGGAYATSAATSNLILFGLRGGFLWPFFLFLFNFFHPVLGGRKAMIAARTPLSTGVRGC